MPEFVLPEFTRSLRALTVPSADGSEHDRVLKPLMAARTAAQKVQSVDAQVAAFDAARLEREWREAITGFAAARHPKSPPDRRALEAELDGLGAPLWRALRSLGEQAAVVRAAKADERRSAWERWVREVQGVFDAADDWWRHAQARIGPPQRQKAGFFGRRK